MIVLDASAVLAVIFNEPGRHRVDAVMGDACIGAVNLAEVVARLSEQGGEEDRILNGLRPFKPMCIDLSVDMATTAGLLRAPTRHLGLSLGDRCCLALAMHRGLRVMTADKAWAGLDLGVTIEVIR